MTTRVVLLDRDGVVNRNRPSYVRTVEELEVLPGVGQALAELSRAGFRTLVVTNQACVGKGLVAPAMLEAIHAKLRVEVERFGGRIDAFYVCPHHPDEGCECRKPKPGLIQAAQREWGFVPGETWMVGDAPRDVEAARRAGCRPALVRTGMHEGGAALEVGVPVLEDLLDFASALIAGRLPAAER